jgi:hypothetical protein
MSLPPFSFEQTKIEEISRLLGKLYKRVDLSKDPMFGWVQIINDATILGEELRRSRNQDAVERAGKIFMRLFEFIGYYLYEHSDSGSGVWRTAFLKPYGRIHIKNWG